MGFFTNNTYFSSMTSFDFSNQNHIVFSILAIIIVVLIFLLLRYKTIAFLKERKVKKRFERGNKLELQAKSFLKSKGYTVVDYQSTYQHKYRVDGVTYTSEIEPDYIVKKKGKKYIVEVKSGTSAISVRNRNTRRQLLEYDYVVENDGVFLLDMENRNLQLIEFKPKGEKRANKLIKAIIILAIIGIAIPYWQVKVAIGAILALAFFKDRF